MAERSFALQVHWTPLISVRKNALLLKSLLAYRETRALVADGWRGAANLGCHKGPKSG